MSENYHWVCDRCARGREEKTLGWGAQGWGYCAECTESLSPSGRNAHYVAKKNSAMMRTGVSDAELRHALAHYSDKASAATSGMMRAAGSAMSVHHTLPCMVVTGCGVLLSKLEKDYDKLGVSLKAQIGLRDSQAELLSRSLQRLRREEKIVFDATGCGNGWVRR